MRVFALVAVAALAFAAATQPGSASPTTSLALSAPRVEYFSDRFVINADGGVRVRLSDGTVVRGQTFGMDLKANRWLVAGDVQVDGPAIHESGAAIAGFLDLDKTYFLPASGLPDRWTYFGSDWSDPHAGREQPGDAFAFPDGGTQSPYIRARSATIIPKNIVTFGSAGVRNLGVYVPTPRYVIPFSQNSHYFENAFSGARFDIGVPFNGSSHALSAFHLRNNATQGTYLSFDQHFVWEKDWVVLAVDPVTQPQRQYNLIGYKRFSPALEGRVFGQLSALQYGIVNQPADEGGFGQVQINAGLRHSGLSFTQNNYWWYLLNVTATDPDLRHRQHPSDQLLTWLGFQNRVGLSPAYVQLRSGIGHAHDQFGEAGIPGQTLLPDAWYHFAGATLYAPSIRTHDLTFSLKTDKQRTWYNIPHQTDVTDSSISVGHAKPKHSEFLVHEIINYADLWGANQLLAYPPQVNTQTTAFGTFSGLAAYRGIGTTRTTTAGLVLTPTPYVSLSTQLSHHHDSPAAVPGLWGTVPWQITADLRLRLAAHIGLDINRSYYFNFADQRWTPQLGIQFTQ